MLRLILSTAAGLLISAVVANAFTWNPEKEQQAQNLVKQFQALHRVPSVAVSITVGGSPVLTKSFNVDGSTVPGGEHIRYRIGSVSKQFTAAAILALIEDRTIIPYSQSPIILDTPLSDLFPIAGSSSDVGQVTVRRLLAMTSNFPSYTNDPLMFAASPDGVVPATRPIDAFEIIERLKTYRLTGPAQAFDYSNTNYFLLAWIADALKGGYILTNPPASQVYIHRRILAKAGMTSSGFVREPSPPGAVDAQPTFLRAALVNQGAWPKGAGDLVSTATDMARWNTALMSGRVIGEAALETKLAPVAQVTGSGPYRDCRYAMGWYVCDRPDYRLHQHDGVISGFMASNAIARRKDGAWMSATVMGNSDATVDIVALARNLIEAGR